LGPTLALALGEKDREGEKFFEELTFLFFHAWWKLQKESGSETA
jgi:hypothetical protein